VSASTPRRAVFSRISSTSPSVVTKRMRLVGGELTKSTSANITGGTVERITVGSLAELAQLLVALGPHQCLAYGITPGDVMALVTRLAWLRAGRPAGQVARTLECFAWPQGPGILMLDFDPLPNAPVMARDALVAAVRLACPALADAAMLWWPSASSSIYNGETGDELRGLRGQRLYLLVQDARDIPRAGAALCEHLAAAGHLGVLVSRAGRVLDRSLFDTSVWQPNRIDFAAGAECAAPLAQRRGAPVRIDGDVEFVDTRSAIPDPDAAVRRAADAHRAAMRAAHADDAAQVRAAWKLARVGELVTRAVAAGRGTADEVRPGAEAHVDRALDRAELCGDWLLLVLDHDGSRLELTVGRVLDDPYRWHGMRTLDPLEPEYDGGRPTGKLYLVGARPNLFSFAHGGCTFKLVRQLHRVELVRGRISDVVDSTLEVMRRSPLMFDRGTEVAVPVGDGKLLHLERDSAPYMLASEMQFFKLAKMGEDIVEVLADPPPQVCAAMLALRGRRGLKQLDAVVSMPLMRRDGTLMQRSGYDPDTRLLLDLSEPAQPVPEYPTADELAAALARLWEPFAGFPFVGPTDRAVYLAALFTAVQRPILETAPAFAFDAPRQGTGKTLLGECAGVIATGERPNIWPHVADNEEETRKRLLTSLRSASGVLMWDNIVGTFDSPSLAGLLTSSVYTDRVLGASTQESYPNRQLVLLTGNNFTAAGELPRRVLTARLDAQSERPFTRTFTFNPVDMCRAYRPALVGAVLTLLRGYVAAGRPRSDAPALGSFGEWDAMVRQAVLWVGATVAPTGMFGDPVDSILDRDTDPADEALGALMKAWR
jgi:hypothetical protein